MIPIEKVQDLIARHDDLEKELSSGNIDPKLFAQKSKEYSNLGKIIYDYEISREKKYEPDLTQFINMGL